MNSLENELLVVPTSDGSNTLLHRGLNQTYHSVNGAVQEARHVFLQNGLQYYLQRIGGSEGNDDKGNTAIRILEVGFGTGLNFLVTADWSLRHNVRLDYTGVEPFPVPVEILEKSAYRELIGEAGLWNDFLARYSGGRGALPDVDASKGAGAPVRLQIIPKPILGTGPLPPADIVYFDAFAPATQPEMWTPEVIGHTASSLTPGGVLVSYSITGNLKRILKSLGFKVEKPKGAAGKREMIRALKP